uniref:Ycf1 n=1 Tax=Codium arabicum TaxID=221038 RepID=A0A386B0H6_CODAR|nr:hypothetical protein Ycf1 [Codium arabicum]AYC65189.1 hypothetical protein Ycf1 [Codium arabicum]
MCLTQEFKNYIYFLLHFENNITFSSFFMFLKFNCCYIIQMVQNWLIYIFQFQWFSDFIYLFISLPTWNMSLINDFFVFQSPTNLVYDYVYTPNNNSNLFILGLGNSFFYWIPHSSVHFLILRRFLVEGLPAGLSACFGSLFAQILFTFMSLFGIHCVLNTWIHFEISLYLFSICFLFIVTYKIVHTPIKRSRFYQTKQLFLIFCINFSLIFFENYGIFPYISSLTFNESTSFLQFQNSTNIQIYIYIIGFFIGSLIWIGLFGYSIAFLSQFLATYFAKSYSHWIQMLNFTFLTLILANLLASVPFYSLDYLFLSSLGFYSEDLRTQNTLLKTNIADIPKGRLGEYSAHSSIDTDIALYNRGRYSTGNEVELTFEDLNFQGEYIWRTRSDRLASGSVGIINPFMSKFLPKQIQNQSKENQLNLESELSKTKNLLDSTQFEQLLTRFFNDYNAEVFDSYLIDSSMDQDSFSAFSELSKYGFDSFASLEDFESDEFEEELGKKIKQKYYKNDIYKILLKLDISYFLKRQPSTYKLTQKEENTLFNKKLILMNYYNSLRSYSYLPYCPIFKILFNNAKSYANRVYNQQYKGTLKIVRRLFLIDFSSVSPNSSILKYDQLLYKEKKYLNLFWHEELKPKKNKLKRKSIYDYQSIPFYIGWDQTKRKLMITNRFINIQNSFPIKKTFNSGLNFVAWPIQRRNFLEHNKYSYLFYQFDQTQNELQKDLFSYHEQGDLDTQIIYDTLPTLIQRVDLRNKDKSTIQLKPIRAGLSWWKRSFRG